MGTLKRAGCKKVFKRSSLGSEMPNERVIQAEFWKHPWPASLLSQSVTYLPAEHTQAANALAV